MASCNLMHKNARKHNIRKDISFFLTKHFLHYVKILFSVMCFLKCFLLCFFIVFFTITLSLTYNTILN